MAGRMNLATLMMLRNGNNREEGGGRRYNEYGGEGRRYNEYEGEARRYGEYGGEGRRYSEYGGGTQSMMPFYPPYAEPGMRRRAYTRNDGNGGSEMRRRYETRGAYDEDMPESRRMGFGENDDDGAEMRRRRRKDGTFMHYGESREDDGPEPIRFGGMVAMEGGKSRKPEHMTRELAEEWTESLENADPSKPRGAKWTAEQIKPIAQKYGVPTEGERFWEFFAAMNMLYSDYYAVAKKYNALNADFFADMAMAFINDKDAVENKVAAYYNWIVEK